VRSGWRACGWGGARQSWRAHDAKGIAAPDSPRNAGYQHLGMRSPTRGWRAGIPIGTGPSIPGPATQIPIGTLRARRLESEFILTGSALGSNWNLPREQGQSVARATAEHYSRPGDTGGASWPRRAACSGHVDHEFRAMGTSFCIGVRMPQERHGRQARRSEPQAAAAWTSPAAARV